MKVVINHSYTYETTETDVQIGDIAVMPTFWDPYETWQGTVTSLTGTYDGPCKRILRIEKPQKK